MNTQRPWQFNEFAQVGKDYASQAEVDVYDAEHGQFRDLIAECEAALDALGVKSGDMVVDFGAGTGTFAIQAARRGATVHAVDVSEAMIARARTKAADADVFGITFHHAGFLTYTHPGPPADAIATTFAFHHLPDFWKGIALTRMRALLKPGGRLYMRDVVLTADSPLEAIDAFIARQDAIGGEALRVDAEGHFRDEFSTYDWVLDGLLERAGFRIARKDVEGGVLATYLCAAP